MSPCEWKLTGNHAESNVFLCYRGKNATKYLDKRRVGANGSLQVKVPNARVAITVVSKYTHSGSCITADGSLAGDARAKTRSALAAYMPISNKVFGSRRIGTTHKLWFNDSLVLSRLLFNAHILVLYQRLRM